MSDTLTDTNTDANGFRLTSPKAMAVLNEREDSDHKVELLYSAFTCATYIRVTQKWDDQVLIGICPNEEAAWAFQHPYMYV